MISSIFFKKKSAFPPTISLSKPFDRLVCMKADHVLMCRDFSKSDFERRHFRESDEQSQANEILSVPFCAICVVTWLVHSRGAPLPFLLPICKAKASSFLSWTLRGTHFEEIKGWSLSGPRIYPWIWQSWSLIRRVIMLRLCWTHFAFTLAI